MELDLRVLAPFTIHEGDFALYLADASGKAGSSTPVFIGGRLEQLEPELDFTKVRLDRHGDSFGRIYHSDEEHRFTVKNLWVMQRSSQLMPRIRRNQQYVFVIRWYDQENRTWALRTYYGVTADGHRILQEDQVHHQGIPFTAQFCEERSGLGAPPDLSVVTTGSVLYVSESEVLPIYNYNFGTSGFDQIVSDDLLASRATIATISDGGPVVTMEIGGSLALTAGVGGIKVNELTAIGGTFPIGAVQFPRLEFWLGSNRIASLTKAGELALPDLNEVDSEPVIAEDHLRILLGSTWVATLAKGAGYAADFSETLE